jgi:hypothetical protein
MKRVGTLTTTVALMLNLGVASVYAQQVPVTLSFSGTSATLEQARARASSRPPRHRQTVPRRLLRMLALAPI